MRKRYFYTIPFLFLHFASFSQIIFKGRIVSKSSDEALSSASVYFNNTSLGTFSNEKGEFGITLPEFTNPELIISSVGFETIVYIIRPGENFQVSHLFKLDKKERLMQNVLILPDATRRKYLKRFIDNFLGLTEEAASSKIQNPDAIYFTKPAGEEGSISAYSDTPLMIINKRLGYKIYFELHEFYNSEITGRNFFYGFTRYEELGDKKRWTRNRKKAYYGSCLHFYRSLINNTLEEESYKIFIVKEQGKMDMAIPVTAGQIITKDSTDSNMFIATWKKKLMVQYNKQPASMAYLSQRTSLNGALHHGFRSYLIINEPSIFIDKSGILVDPLSVSVTGYWIYEKAANLLPYNYYPDKEN